MGVFGYTDFFILAGSLFTDMTMHSVIKELGIVEKIRSILQKCVHQSGKVSAATGKEWIANGLTN